MPGKGDFSRHFTNKIGPETGFEETDYLEFGGNGGEDLHQAFGIGVGDQDVLGGSSQGQEPLNQLGLHLEGPTDRYREVGGRAPMVATEGSNQTWKQTYFCPEEYSSSSQMDVYGLPNIKLSWFVWVGKGKR